MPISIFISITIVTIITVTVTNTIITPISDLLSLGILSVEHNRERKKMEAIQEAMRFQRTGMLLVRYHTYLTTTLTTTLTTLVPINLYILLYY